MADLEARYAQLEAEAASPRLTMPCSKCRHMEWGLKSIVMDGECNHPLVKGFATGPVVLSFAEARYENPASLCGPEKALWEPKRKWWQRLYDWFVAPWKESA